MTDGEKADLESDSTLHPIVQVKQRHLKKGLNKRTYCPINATGSLNSVAFKYPKYKCRDVQIQVFAITNILGQPLVV